MSLALLVKNREEHSVLEGLCNSFEKDQNLAIFFHQPTSLKFSKIYETIFQKYMKQFFRTYGRRYIITYPRLKCRMLKFQFMTVRKNVTTNNTKVTDKNKFRNISIPNSKSSLKFWFWL